MKEHTLWNRINPEFIPLKRELSRELLVRESKAIKVFLKQKKNKSPIEVVADCQKSTRVEDKSIRSPSRHMTRSKVFCKNLALFEGNLRNDWERFLSYG